VLLSILLRASPGAVTRCHIQLAEMIVSVALYEKLRAAVLEAISTNRKLTAKDAVHLEVEYDALLSLYGQLFVRNLKTESRTINPRIMKQLVARSQSGESLVDLANEFHFGSFKFAKLYLEAIGEGDTQLSSLLTDPMQIKDARIRKELLQLIANDPICSPELEQVKECLGREYEELLISLLNQKKMCFETEAELRLRGKPKTPDILFQIPMATPCTLRDLQSRIGGRADTTASRAHGQSVPLATELSSSASPGTVHSSAAPTAPAASNDEQHPTAKVVINWIDSKAMFADALTFEENLEQFRAYNNRYGRGMVIYWHGFVEDILGMLPDDRIIVRDCFPEEWMFPTGEKADGRVPAFDLVTL
jgi:hypothetical protein